MAVYYTDFINGDDATGTGSWAAPFKTIYKGTQSISANGDEVRVVGGAWSANLPGTLTFTYGSSTVSTSSDLTSYFPELSATPGNDKVVITVDDQFGFGKTVLVVTAVSATTLTLFGIWLGDNGALAVKRLDNMHYYITSAPTSPSGIASTVESMDFANISLYTDIKVTGGWTADGVQDGVTAFVNAAVNGTSSSYNAFKSNASITTEGDFEMGGFLTSHFAYATNNDASSRYAITDWWAIRVVDFAPGANFIFWNSKSGNPANFYVYDTVMNDTWNVAIGTQGLFNMNIWQTGRVTQTNAKYGVRADGKYMPQYHIRSQAYTPTYDYPGICFFNEGSYSNNIRVGEFHVYNNNTAQNCYIPVSGEARQSGGVMRSIEKLYVKGDNAAGTFIGLPQVALNCQSVVGDGTQDLISTLAWTNLDTGNPFSSQDVRQTYSGSTLVKDVNGDYRYYANDITGAYVFEGHLLAVNTVEFDTGSNSLELIPNLDTSGTEVSYHAVAQIPYFSDTRTLTIRMKTNGIDTSAWTDIVVNNREGNMVTQSVTLTSGWANYTVSIDGSSALNQEYYSVFIKQSPLSGQTGRLYVDSVSVA